MQKANIITVSDFSASELDVYARLNEAQLFHYNEPQKGIFVAESPNVIERAMDAGCVPVSFLMEEKYVEGKGSSLLSRYPNVPCYAAHLEVLEQLTGFKLTRGMLCAMERPDLPKASEVVENARRIVILENIVNPTNTGAIFRSAAALGIDAVLLTKACCDPLYRRSARVSMGTVFQIPWTYIDGSWPEDGLAFLKEKGFKTVAMALCDDSISMGDSSLHEIEKMAIIMGTEGDGLGEKTIATCDYTVKIPMSAGVDSLNVAAASAVAFWELTK